MSVPLSEIPVAYCDSLEALRQAWKEGLPRDARIRTASPAVHSAGINTVESLEAAPRKIDLSEYWEGGSDLTREAFQALSGQVDTAEIALLGARSMLFVHRALQKATRLDADDFTQPRAALLVDAPSTQLDALLNGPWPAFFVEHERYAERRYAVHLAPQPEVVAPPLRLKLRQIDLPRLFYFAGIRLKGRLAALTGRRALIFRENELVEDVVCSLMRHGYTPLRLDNVNTVADAEPKLLDRAEAVLRPTIDRFLDRWFVREVHGAARRMVRTEMSRFLGTHAATRVAWRGQLRGLRTRRTVLVTNFPGGPEGVSLAETCREMGISFIVAQHGVTREISDTHRPIEVYFENGTSDLFLTFNQRAQELTEASPFARGHVRTVGLPRAYRRLSRRQGQNRDFPILYISTALMKGNVNLATGGASDIDRVVRERAIVNNVLAHLPQKVLYKTYPSRDRYVDTDPLYDDLERHANVGVFRHNVDLRYFIREHQVLIASRATSTIGWCLMADRPLVFINFPDDSPLSPDARAAFEAGVFVFDWTSSDMLDDLRAFLSRPIEMIRADWQAKARKREQLIRDFITPYRSGAGRRGAAAVLEASSNGGGRDGPACHKPQPNRASLEANQWTK